MLNKLHVFLPVLGIPCCLSGDISRPLCAGMPTLQKAKELHPDVRDAADADHAAFLRLLTAYEVR